jgi:hypothetical protein
MYKDARIAYTDFVSSPCSAFPQSMEMGYFPMVQPQQYLLLPLLLGPASTYIPSVCGSSMNVTEPCYLEARAASSVHYTTIPSWPHEFARYRSAEYGT